jgi:hypothetical protein
VRYLFAEGRVRYLFAEGRVRYLFAEGRVRCLCTQSSESKGRRRSLLPFDTEV